MTSRAKKLLSENIKRLRQANGWTMRILAERMRVSESMVSIWESGKGWIDDDTFDKLADAFQVPHSVILAGEDTMHKPVNERPPTLREALKVINESNVLLSIKPRRLKS